MSVPALYPGALCLCEVEVEGQTRACPCGPCWAPGPEAAAGVDLGPLRLAEEDERHVDCGGSLTHYAGPVCVDGPWDANKFTLMTFNSVT